MKNYLPILILLFFSAQSASLSAATITAVKKGKWSKNDTWDLGRVPEAGDDVIIDGYEVEFGGDVGDVIINSLTIRNLSDNGKSQLKLKGTKSLTVNNDLSVIMGAYNHDTEFRIEGTGLIVNVLGNASFIRTADNQNDAKLHLHLASTSELNISGTFTFDHKK